MSSANLPFIELLFKQAKKVACVFGALAGTPLLGKGIYDSMQGSGTNLGNIVLIGIGVSCLSLAASAGLSLWRERRNKPRDHVL